MTAVQNLCTKAVHLNKGEILQIGNVLDVINNYLAKGIANDLKKEWETIESAPGNESVKIKRIQIVPDFQEQGIIDVRTPINIYFEFWNLKANQEINLSFHLYNRKGDCIMNVGSAIRELGKGLAKGHLQIPGNFLNDDSYYLSTMIVKDKSVVLYNLEDAVSFTVEDYRENGAWFGKWIGAVRPTFLPFSLTQTTSKAG
jgi:lipopolysaccharide transport system ATP-binding protein